MKLDKSFSQLILDVHELSPLEWINRCIWRDFVSEKKLKYLAKEVQSKIRDMLFMKVIYEKYPEDNIKLLLKKKMKVSLNLWNFCPHECRHCSIDWNMDWSIFDFEAYMFLMEKYSQELKYVNAFFFTGGELLDREELPLIIEEALKRWVYAIEFVTRWGLVFQPRNIRNIISLKERYKNFDLNLALSMDNYSETNNKKTNKYLDRLTEIIVMQFEIFKKESVDFISTIPFDDAEEANNEVYKIARKINRLWNRLKKAWFKFTKHQLIDWFDNFYFEKDWRSFTISVVYQMLVWCTDKGRRIKWSWAELGREDACRYLNFSENSTFYVDDAMNLNYCSNISHWFDDGKWIINLMESPKKEVIRMFLRTKQRFYDLLTYDEITEYVINPENKHLCSKLRQELSIIKK
ncbi:MAG: hypothetical protein ACD_3C00112G0004 [uncultured bacterium (gcode 4)]|uniref:Radical SAM protein n=1 Tax=uncultured bacterium (gcode 4) TaxID=1234023 RepID=K2FA19_9BACT|nr:MAG: hypothetical protein ACD_3C00112G0004 [uncultured bacterium (gcode 4)]